LIKKKLKLRITCLVILCNNIKQEEQRWPSKDQKNIYLFIISSINLGVF
jgi:hypothetical protein